MVVEALLIALCFRVDGIDMNVELFPIDWEE